MSIMQAALPTGFEVWFGKAMPVYPAPQMLQVVAIRPGENELITMGPDYKQDEHYEFECVLTSWAGNPDNPGRLQEVFGLLQSITVAIAQNPTLNGAVRFAYVKTWDYEPDSDETGRTLGCLHFNVAAEARITTLQ